MLLLASMYGLTAKSYKEECEAQLETSEYIKHICFINEN